MKVSPDESDRAAVLAPVRRSGPRATSGRILRTFARETNVEGVNNAGRSASSARAAAWLGVFTVLAALTVRKTHSTVNTNIWLMLKRNSKSKATFPSMLQCCRPVISRP